MTNKELYRSICTTQPSLPLFLQHWWMDAVCDDWDVAIAKKGDHVSGVWPYARTQRMGVSLMRNPRLTPYLGPHVFIPADVKESSRDSFEYEAVAELMSAIPNEKVWHLSLQPGFRQAGIFKEHGLQLQVQQTFLIDLTKDEATLFSDLKESLRRNIRTAEKEITISNEPQYLAQLYEFQKQTLSAKDVQQPYTLAQMQQLYDAAAAHNSTALWVAKAGAEVQAIIWNVWDAERSYYFMGAKNPATDNYRAMAALLWHAIQQARQRGNTCFDLEGSMEPGVERFFRGFGGTRQLYIILRKNTSLLWKLKEMIRG